DIRNPRLKSDYLALRYGEIETLTIQVGGTRELPDALQELPRYQLENLSDANEVAAKIAHRIWGQK
ncbi:MAG: hypothetical protein JW862_19275, partial [Anaerolineales bacterium]|nr:hypothetical protein [Anaerolineales bacterium]